MSTEVVMRIPPNGSVFKEFVCLAEKSKGRILTQSSCGGQNRPDSPRITNREQDTRDQCRKQNPDSASVHLKIDVLIGERSGA